MAREPFIHVVFLAELRGKRLEGECPACGHTRRVHTGWCGWDGRWLMREDNCRNCSRGWSGPDSVEAALLEQRGGIAAVEAQQLVDADALLEAGDLLGELIIVRNRALKRISPAWGVPAKDDVETFALLERADALENALGFSDD